jgi:hypothetical protein
MLFGYLLLFFLLVVDSVSLFAVLFRGDNLVQRIAGVIILLMYNFVSEVHLVLT